MPSHTPEATQAVLTVDLAAVVANWRDLRARHPTGAVAGVVKADAYGLGAAEVGRALRDAGCTTFFVAHLTEGLALREALGAGPVIAVLNGFPPCEEADWADLWPVLNTLGDIEAHAAHGKRQGVPIAAILHVDTGMSRLGLDARELDALAADHGRLAGIDLRYVMSHLACADEPEHPLNALQAERFAAACARLPAGVPSSLPNSAGMFLGADFASDLARPGCALYGINPTPGRPNPMRQVACLEAPVVQMRDIPAGATVGYGASARVERPTRVATVAAGYADGYLRSLSNHGVVGSFQGMPVPLLGRVSMDLTTFDVTDLAPAAAIDVGDRIALLGGPGCTPDDLAVRADTIGYELLTSLGARYRRVYRGG
jgi:alanine racemase